MRFTLTSILWVLLLAACSSSAAEENAQACDLLAAQTAGAANDYFRSAGDALDPYAPAFPGPPPPPLPAALDALPQRFEQAGCSRLQAGDALRLHATDVRGNGIGAQAMRQAMLDGDADLRALLDVIAEARPPS